MDGSALVQISKGLMGRFTLLYTEAALGRPAGEQLRALATFARTIKVNVQLRNASLVPVRFKVSMQQ